MIILGIETSCDDTASALVEAKRGRFRVIRELRSSQIDLHKQYGGVVPEVAARAHAELIMPLIRDAIARSSKSDEAIQMGLLRRARNDIKPDVIAVTAGPGLITALMVGVQTAASLSYAWNIPLVAVNHIEGHIYGNWLDKDTEIKFPALALIVSGGHTELILMKDHGKYQLIGKTRDDAAGECFDKVGKLLGFDYPGGPKISECAEGGDKNAIPFPRPMIDSGDYDFSFAGLKTAALYWLRNNRHSEAQSAEESRMHEGRATGSDHDDWRRHFCASFEQAIVEVLVTKTIRAAKEFRPASVILGGGVAANKHLRATLAALVSTDYPEGALTLPPLFATVDNAPMIAVAGYFHARRKNFTPWNKITADPNWRIA